MFMKVFRKGDKCKTFFSTPKINFFDRINGMFFREGMMRLLRRKPSIQSWRWTTTRCGGRTERNLMTFHRAPAHRLGPQPPNAQCLSWIYFWCCFYLYFDWSHMIGWKVGSCLFWSHLIGWKVDSFFYKWNHLIDWKVDSFFNWNHLIGW